MEIQLENCQITSYQLGVLDADADRFDFAQLTNEPTGPQAEQQKAPSKSEITVTKVTNSTSPLPGEVNHSEFAIVKRLDKAFQSDEGPEETVAFYHGKLGDQTLDDLAVDPNNPNGWSSGHTGGANFAMGDGSVRNSHTDAGYYNPSSFQIISAGKDEAEHVSYQGWGHFEHSNGTTPLFSEDDAFDFSQLTTEPLATAFPGFAGGVRVACGDVNGDDDKPDLLVGRSGSDWTLDFQPQLTTEPMAPAGPGAPGGHVKVFSYYDLPAVQTDDGLLLPAVQTDGGDASPTGRTDGVFNVILPPVPTGDEVLVAFEHGDPHDALGDPVTFTYTVRNTSSAYEGTHALYQDVFIPPLDTEPLTTLTTGDLREVPGQPTVAMETLTTAHEGLLI